MENKRERLLEVLEHMTGSDLVAVHNKYCEECNYPDDIIYPMSEIEEHVGNVSAMTLMQMIHDGDFNPNNAWFWYDYKGDLMSSDYPEYGENQRIFTHDIVSAMLRNDDGFGDDECQSIIDEEEEEDEE